MSRPDRHWLTREQIDEVIADISAADILAAVGDGTAGGAKVAGAIFDSAAARLEYSNGAPATASVRAADFKYLADQLGSVVNVDSPLSEGTSDLLASAASGE